MIGLILVCHGDLARTLVETAEEIVGPIEGVRTISNQGKAPEIADRELAEAIAAFEDVDGILVMVDLFGSSCWRCSVANARRLRGARPPVALVSGINLGALLSFSQKRHTLGFRELAEAMVKDACRGVNGPLFFAGDGT